MVWVDASYERTIERVIHQMQEKLGDELTIDDMARAALFSKFHFSRLFQRVTGISPGRFLSALRLERAKQLLVSTPLNVIDISHRVGYTSVGTFSSRFSSCVGISPTTYRRLGGFGPEMLPEQTRVTGDTGDVRLSTTVSGRVLAAPTVGLGPIFVGLFPDPLPQGRPVRCAVLSRPGPYLLRDVPRGTWHVMTYAVPSADDIGRAESPEARRPYVGSVGPIRIRPNTDVGSADVQLRPKRLLDPPVLIALPDLRNGNGLGPLVEPDEAADWDLERAG